MDGVIIIEESGKPVSDAKQNVIVFKDEQQAEKLISNGAIVLNLISYTDWLSQNGWKPNT